MMSSIFYTSYQELNICKLCEKSDILCVDRKIYITIKYEYLSFLKTQTTFVTFLLVRFFIHYLQRISWSRKC